MDSRHILIVEDDEAIRRLVQVIAEREGYSHASATNGAEAIEALRGIENYCAVILDLMMPSVDGYEVIRHIQKQPTRVPVVVVTAAIRSIEWGKIDKSIVTAVLTKPFDVQTLSEALASACARGQ